MSRQSIKRIELIGAPVGLGGSHEGTALGPTALRLAGLENRLTSLGFEVLDRGDVPCKRSAGDPVCNRVRHMDAISDSAALLSAMAYSAMATGALPIIIGGDHSVSFGSVNGIARFYEESNVELAVLWIDAHADFNTPETSPTGNMHGMSAAFICGEPGMAEMINGVTRHSIAPTNLYLFGTRWLDPEEEVLLTRRGVQVFDARAICRRSISDCISEIIESVKSKNAVLHVSFDLDFLDPSAAPGVGTPEPCGFSVLEAHAVLEMLSESGLVSSIDVVELNPLLDHANKCGFLLIDLLSTLLGHRIHDPTLNTTKRGAMAELRYGK